VKQIFRNIRHVAQRELGRMFIRPLYMFASVGVMVLCTVFFLSIMKRGAPERMPVAVVDHDQTSISRRLCHETNATQSVEIVLITPNFADARLAMQQGEVYGILDIPEGFYADIVSMKQPTLHFYVNNAYTVGANTAYKQLLTMCNLTSGAFQREVLRKKGLPDYLIMERIQPVSISAHLIANPWSNYAIYLVSTILPGILALVVLMLTIFAIGYELKMQSSREWLEVAGGNYTVAMIGKLLPYTVLYVVLGIGCNVILFRFLHFPVMGSSLRMMLAILLLVFAMESMAITIIGALPTLRDAISIGALYGMLGFSLSGFTYPVMNMLPPFQALTWLIPLRHYYEIYVNEALMAGPIVNTIVPMLCLTAFFLFALIASPRLHDALVNNNYPLK
jgi:ABC-2 type transport system permease protein